MPLLNLLKVNLLKVIWAALVVDLAINNANGAKRIGDGKIATRAKPKATAIKLAAIPIWMRNAK
jgi:hypothetical protein